MFEVLKGVYINENNIHYLVEEILSGRLSLSNLHNKRSYARRKGQLGKVLEYGIVFEVVKYGKHSYD